MFLDHLAANLTSPWALAFGVACTLLVVLSAITKRPSGHTLLMALYLWGVWLFSKFIAAIFGWDFARSLYVFTDCIGGLMAVWFFTDYRAWWKAALAISFFSRLTLHVIFIDRKHDLQFYSYLQVLDVLFAIEIICVASSGWTSIARRIGNLLPSGPGRRDLVSSRDRAQKNLR